MTPSLKRRLVALVLSATALIWLAAGLAGWLKARHEAEELLDAHLAQSAALLVAQAGEDLHELDLDRVPLPGRNAHKVAFQIWSRGRLALRSANAPVERFSRIERGFSEVRHGERRWRVFSTRGAEDELLVQVGEHLSARAEIANALGASLALPLAAALPLLALAVWLAVGRGLAPLGALGRELARRDPRALSPLDAAAAPAEARALVEEINALMTRVARMIEREQRFTADAAHELRSPLAALSTQAQVARAASDPARRNEALDALDAGARRAARLVEQLLILARLESERERPGTHCDLRELMRAVLADHAPAALARDIDLTLDEGLPVWIAANTGLLTILARNLVDNAVRYTPAHGRICASVTRDGTRARMLIENSGPGLSAEVRARLGERFYRPEGQDVPGSGLGLSIVKRIAALHGGEVTFASEEGFRVTVDLPLTAD